jgi:deoxyuridine 5'-triphosphate nucleotidohydrolase
MQEEELRLIVECTDPQCIPTRATEGSAAYDLRAPCDFVIPANTMGVPVKFDLQLRVIFPSGYYGKVMPRSSQCLKGIDIMAGVIDSDYSGSISAVFLNRTPVDYQIRKYDRIAQMILQSHVSCPVEVTTNYEEMRQALKGGKETRTAEGFGSTGR